MNNIERLVSALAQPFQDLEVAFQQMLQFGQVGTAFGVGLDRLGAIVGQGRNGLFDDAYARAIATRIVTNRSGGGVEDLIAIAKLFLGTSLVGAIVVKNEGTATVRVSIVGGALNDTLAAQLYVFLRAGASAGVRIVLEWIDQAPSATFTFDKGPGLDVGAFANALG